MTMDMTIILTMNIYINVKNLQSLQDEENKSGLINRLLDEHYGRKTDYPKVQLGTLGKVMEVSVDKSQLAEGLLMEPTYTPPEDVA